MKKFIMISAIIVIFVVAVFLFFSYLSEEKTNDVDEKALQPNSLLPKITGYWLQEQYVNALNVSKSPVAAMEGIYEVYFEIKENNGCYDWLKIYNFHEGVSEIIAGLSPAEEKDFYILQLSNDTGYSYEGQEYRFGIAKLPQVDKLVYFDGESTMNFVRIDEDAESYANRVALSGKYKDVKGLIYEFTKDARANWPEESFKYDLNIDPVFNRYDYFWVINKDDQNSLLFYCFERKENQLFLYRGQLVEDEFMEREEKPFLVLEKIE